MEHIRFVYADAPVKTVAAAPLSPPPEMPPATAKAPVALTEPVRRRQGAKGTAKAAVFLGQAEGPGRTDVRDHDFRISGHAPFRPTQVYTDGRKTYIELPEGVQESPVLFRRKKGGFLGLGHSLQLVNHRYHGRWVVVDAVLDDAVLQSGVGSAKTQVVISRVAAHE
jgi:type IV secretory pathway VirB9-like protein